MLKIKIITKALKKEEKKEQNKLNYGWNCWLSLFYSFFYGICFRDFEADVFNSTVLTWLLWFAVSERSGARSVKARLRLEA
jgi:hypothetical protein